MTTPFKPVTTSDSLDKTTFDQMNSNQQWLFDNLTKVRYNSGAIIRDNGLKILAGKTAFPARSDANYIHITVNFGTYFTAGCQPILVANVEGNSGSGHKEIVVPVGRAGLNVPIDHNGMTLVISGPQYTNIPRNGWVNWIAVGY